MCFSAPVSFAASGIIGATGIATLRKVKKKEEIPFASLPIIFAIHQFMEGIVWITQDGTIIRYMATYIFLFVAVSLWPFLMPMGVYLLESNENKIRKKIILSAVIIGTIVAIIALTLAIIAPISVHVVCNSLYYKVGIFGLPWYIPTLLQLSYTLAIVGSMFVSSHKFINLYGAIMTISFLITYIFYNQIYFSVWCFFAAILSISNYYFFKKRAQGFLSKGPL